MNINSELIKKIEKFVTEQIVNRSSKDLVYHNVDHTRDVVTNATFIATQDGLIQDELNILLACAWFHDIGYIETYIGHEEKSAKIAADYLKKYNINEDTINLVKECIHATTIPQHPKNKISEILCDADMMHLGQDNYFEKAKKLRRELKKLGIGITKKSQFDKESLKVFNTHTYYSKYGKNKLAKSKDRNFNILQNKINKRKKKSQNLNKIRYSRGVDSMFKVTARNQINLSSIADNKSNILISLNGIIISLGLVGLVSKFKTEPALILPTIIFIVFSLSTIILAILSTRPHLSSRKANREDLDIRKTNLLFFGNFYNMDVDEYERLIEEMINDDKYPYSALTRDQYFLGKVLAKKYKLLRSAYGVFMLGLVVSVIAYLLVILGV